MRQPFFIRNGKLAFIHFVSKNTSLKSAWLKIFFEKKELTKVKRAGLMQDDLDTRLKILRQEIDSYFLFNSLNVLKSGASEEWVKDSVMQLASYYRYLLMHNNGTELTLISEKMQFVQSYINILKERFEDGLVITTQLSLEAKC